MDPLPPQRRSQRVNRGQRFDGRTIGLCHLVTVHAFFNGRNTGLTRSLGAGMAIEARDPESARMESMRIRDGLLRLIPADEPIGLGIPADSRHRGQNRRNPDEQDEFRIVQKILPRLRPKAHLEIFPGIKTVAPPLFYCTGISGLYLLSGVHCCQGMEFHRSLKQPPRRKELKKAQR